MREYKHSSQSPGKLSRRPDLQLGAGRAPNLQAARAGGVHPEGAKNAGPTRQDHCREPTLCPRLGIGGRRTMATPGSTGPGTRESAQRGSRTHDARIWTPLLRVSVAMRRVSAQRPPTAQTSSFKISVYRPSTSGEKICGRKHSFLILRESFDRKRARFCSYPCVVARVTSSTLAQGACPT